ncbi:hypothetical protein M1271_06205 [Patescibacteria group bacterium]|nr:hypothetical protein [Patescibacteria group bacterium]
MDLFIIKLLLSAVVGGSYAAIVTWISEKFGAKLGGLLLGLPSTSLVSLIFIAWTQNANVAIEAVHIIPAAVCAASLFVVAFIQLYKRFGAKFSFLLSFLFWSLLTLPLIAIHLSNIVLSVGIGFVYISVAFYAVRDYPDKKAKILKINGKILFTRGILSGTIICLAVVLSKVLGPLWGGLMGSFPAIFTSSLIILMRAHGIEFTSSVVKRMPYGNFTNIFFALGFYFFVPSFGMVAGTALAYACTIIIAGIMYFAVFPFFEFMSGYQNL